MIFFISFIKDVFFKILFNLSYLIIVRNKIRFIVFFLKYFKIEINIFFVNIYLLYVIFNFLILLVIVNFRFKRN